MPHKILDLGCANGARLFRYAKIGFECIGVDIADGTPDAINAANKELNALQRPPITLIHSDIRKLEPEDFAADKFSVINCSQVIHFMDRDDIIHLLKFIKKIASPTTLICLSFDTEGNTSNALRAHSKLLCDERIRYMNVMGYQPSKDMKHRYYTEADISAILERLELQQHQTIRSQNGLAVMTASTHGDRVFETRPAFKATLRGRLMGYLR